MIRVSSPVFLLLLFAAVVCGLVIANSGNNLVRKRRTWILPPKPLKENKNYTHLEFIAKIRSDFETHDDIQYSLEGVGANQYPFHVFVVDPKTGFIRVTKILDREEYSWYNLSGIAKFKASGKEAEKKIDIRIKVVDENDNPPKFGVIKPGEVMELSAAETTVMKITAIDADEPGNENSEIAYYIVEQNPPHDMFSITKDGTITVKRSSLDREKTDQYTLTVKGQDLNGKLGGHSATSTVTINVLDVNDNPPALEKLEYEGSIEENTKNVEVMRIKTDDLDLKDTENWQSVFEFAKGNEAGYFSIKTDPKTNEGILMLDKEVDYEDVKNLELGLIVRNKAPMYDGAAAISPAGVGGVTTVGGTSETWVYKTYPIKISVKNQPEGPSFDPKVKAIHISEGGNININEFIARYQAIDGDTRKTAENVKYAKGSDPGNWLTIDPKTAEIKLNKMPDRESTYLVNGTYLAKILCITNDMPSKTATGTIAIQVEDFNDNCPTLTSTIQTMCTPNDAVIVNAKDEDAFPNGAPFEYLIIPEGTQGKWHMEHLNETAAILRAQGHVWPGVYEVEILVKDQQGEACPEPQKVTVEVCTCEDGVVCGKRGAKGAPNKTTELGPAGIGLLFLGLLLLLFLLLLLLFCQCGGAGALPGGFAEMPFDTKSHLINYRTEGQGENTDVPLMNLPTQVDGNMDNMGLGAANTSGMPAGWDSSMQVINGGHYPNWFAQREEAWGAMNQAGSVFYSEGRESGFAGRMDDGMALPDHFLRQYYTQKVNSTNDNLGGKDGLLVYDYEGQGSAAGSVGCCSLLESDNDLQFLDDLGTKFKTLAEVCGGKKIPTEVKPVFAPLPSASISNQTSVSSLVTAQQPPPPKLQPSVPQTVIRETSEHSQVVKENTATVREGMTTVREGMTTVKQGIANRGQMVLLQPQQQQPLYYTTAPVMQPMQYVVQPQVQNTMLLAEAPATNLQGMVLVNGTQTIPAQGMVVQGQTVMSSTQAQGPHMVLVESSGIQGGGANLIHTGNVSGSQTMMVVQGKVPKGSLQRLNGSETCVVQGGTLQPGGLSGSQKVLVVGGPTSSGMQLVQEAGGLPQQSGISGSQRVLYSKGSTSAGSQSNVVGSSTTTVSSTPTYRKVVVQETKEIR